MSEPFDLNRYFARIGFEGPTTANLDTLKTLVTCHTRSIPFENLNPFLRLPVKLDIESLEEKILRGGRGGYCFEQNQLFKHALEAIGFQVRGLAARVVINQPKDAQTARSHMLLLVFIDGERYIADVGFGGMTPTGVLRLDTEGEQETPHEPYRVIAEGEEFETQAKVDGEWRRLYRFDLREQWLVDYEVSNWYLSNHPESHFVTGLSAARPDDGVRYALRGSQLSAHRLGKESEKQRLDSVDLLKEALQDVFRLRLPDVEHLDQSLERLIERDHD